jgi:arylsulfatase A-like enzyme
MYAARSIVLLFAFALILAGCEVEPQSLVIQEHTLTSAYLGLPHRVMQRGVDGAAETVAARTITLVSQLRAPARLLQYSSPDSMVLVTSGGPVRVTANLPAVERRDLFGVRVGYRGTLGGQLGLSWREGRDTEFRRAQSSVLIPGLGETATCELGLGPTRVLGTRVAEVGIELPVTEVGTVTLSRVDLLLRPGRVIQRVDIDGVTREVLTPGPGRWLEWNVTVPQDGRLVFDYATHPGMRVSHGDGTRFVVEVVEGTRSTELMDRWLSVFAVPAHRGWQSASLDLRPWVGRQVVVRLSTRAGPPARGVFPASAELRDDNPLFTVPRLVSGADPRPNILLIVIDTLRRDALGVYGGGPSPHLDSLATAGVRFERAWASGSWTHPSVASLLSGWTASKHGLGFGPAGTTRLDPSTPLVTGELRDEGWATAAVSNNKIVSVEEGFARGFVSFDESAFVEDQIYGAQRVTRSALSWVEDHPDGPYFLYLHYFDPHDRYQAPPPWTRMHVDEVADSRIDDSAVRSGRPNAFLETASGSGELSAQELQYMRDLYRGEVSYVDHWLGRLMHGLRDRGALDNTLVVITSDHGEEFLEHDSLKHGHALYEEQIAVPLIVLLPAGGSAGTVISDPVSLLDLAPALRSIAGLDTRQADGDAWAFGNGIQGRNPVAENWRYGEGPNSGPQRALIDWPRKLIEYQRAQTLEFFDLELDPGEQSSSLDAAGIGRMVILMDSLLGTRDDGLGAAPVDPVLLEKLKAMGYVH